MIRKKWSGKIKVNKNKSTIKKDNLLTIFYDPEVSIIIEPSLDEAY